MRPDRPTPPQSQYQHPSWWYDVIYEAQGKDHAAEVDVVLALVRPHVPAPQALLDVGCGTGMHLLQFAEQVSHVRGVDLDEGFAERAVARGLDVTVGDMCTFDLGETFDVVTSLYSAVGHLPTTDALDAAIATMARHLAPGGVLVVEPWIDPADWTPGTFGVEVADGPDFILSRTNHSGLDGEVALLDFAWTHVDAHGITRVREQLRLTCFTEDAYRSAFERAGLEVTFDAAGCNDDGRGLWVGVRRR